MPVILLLRRERSGGSQFEASSGKQFAKPYLKKKPSQKIRAGGVAQGVVPEFKSQNRKNQIY
jgi:hypothetical protein